MLGDRAARSSDAAGEAASPGLDGALAGAAAARRNGSGTANGGGIGKPSQRFLYAPAAQGMWDISDYVERVGVLQDRVEGEEDGAGGEQSKSDEKAGGGEAKENPGGGESIGSSLNLSIPDRTAMRGQRLGQGQRLYMERERQDSRTTIPSMARNPLDRRGYRKAFRRRGRGL